HSGHPHVFSSPTRRSSDLIWTPFSHALLHGGWEHLIVNAAWLGIFATPVSRRYGAGPMLAIFFVSAAAGAAFFAVTTLYSGAYLDRKSTRLNSSHVKISYA